MFLLLNVCDLFEDELADGCFGHMDTILFPGILTRVQKTFGFSAMYGIFFPCHTQAFWSDAEAPHCACGVRSFSTLEGWHCCQWTKCGESWACGLLSKRKAEEPAVKVDLHFGCLYLAT